MNAALEERVAAALAAPVAEPVRLFAARLARQPGCAAVMFYGSNLRTGSLDGVLDFYVLKDGPLEKGIWPRVSYHEWDHEGTTLRAKVATMTLATFARAAAGDLIDTTIWARFVQPSALAWQRDAVAGAEVRAAVADAAMTAAKLAVALGPTQATAQDYWRCLFRATYRAEFRVEKPGREDSILSVNAAHFDGLLPAALTCAGIPFAQHGELLTTAMIGAERKRIQRWWLRRRRLGKLYNLVRLLRASTTFEGAGRYAAWKVERHTGVAVPMTPWREKHPVLASPGVLWRVWRARKAPR